MYYKLLLILDLNFNGSLNKISNFFLVDNFKLVVNSLRAGTHGPGSFSVLKLDPGQDAGHQQPVTGSVLNTLFDIIMAIFIRIIT